MAAGTLEGRVEVCINNAWGTVCDNFFGQEDAETVCASIGGFNRAGEIFNTHITVTMVEILSLIYL